MGRDSRSRGEYRAVAEHYTANGFDDTFNDDVSFADIDDGYDDHKNQQHVLEMKDLDNGGPSLEEMNG